MHTRTHGVELCDGFVSGSGTAPVRPVLALGLQEQRRLKPPRVAVVGFERLAQIPAQRHRLGRPVNLKRCSARTGEHACTRVGVFSLLLFIGGSETVA